jgi:predicted transposase/invertase (TIGR01784 family)
LLADRERDHPARASQMPSKTTPHDALFKLAFGQPDLARSELELVLPAAVKAHLDLATLHVCPGSFVDDNLRHAHADLLYRVQVRDGTQALVYVLFEHQSTFDPRMPLRLLQYLVRIWEAWERDHPGTRLPVVIPIVLCHDPSGWRAPPDFASMLDATPELLAAVGPFQPLFRFVLDDLEAHSLEELAARELHALALLVQLAFWSARSGHRLRQVGPKMASIVAGLARDARARSLLTQLYGYLLRDAPPGVEAAEVRAILEQVAGPEGKEDLVNAGEQLIAEGIAKGIERGRTEGLRAAIERVLAARSVILSEVGRTRLAACADSATLTRWLERAATAASEAEVFAGEPSA